MLVFISMLIIIGKPFTLSRGHYSQIYGNHFTKALDAKQVSAEKDGIHMEH